MNSARRLPPLPANTNSNYGSVRQMLALKQDFSHEKKKFAIRAELFSEATDSYLVVSSHFVCPEGLGRQSFSYSTDASLSAGE